MFYSAKPTTTVFLHLHDYTPDQLLSSNARPFVVDEILTVVEVDVQIIEPYLSDGLLGGLGTDYCVGH